MESLKKDLIAIKEIGSYFETDEDGYLINPASNEKITGEWKKVVEEIVQLYKSIYGESLVSVYVRGSVAKGEAIEGISDVDTLAYLNLPKEQIKRDWKTEAERGLLKKFPFAKGIELTVKPVGKAEADRKFILQSVCVFGEELGKDMTKMKVGKETLGHVYSISKNLKFVEEWLDKSQSREEIKKSCVWIMKGLLRAGFELTMERAGLYTRDLYPSYKTFSEYYPEKEPEMREVLNLAINPTGDIDEIKRIIKNIGTWMVGQTAHYKK